MAKNIKNPKEELKYLNLVVVVILIIFLSIFNLASNKNGQTVYVLGAETEDYTSYWLDFVKKHPTYKMGWFELGEMEKVYSIDPNFIP